jgi:hypothetical protein
MVHFIYPFLKESRQKSGPQTKGNSRMDEALKGLLIAGGTYAFGWIMFVLVLSPVAT